MINLISMQKEYYSSLTDNIREFESVLNKRKLLRVEKGNLRKQALNELQETIEEKNNSMMSKIEDLKRKETILITLRKIQPEIPEAFPKNYFCQLVYEDATLTGNQKFTDFDQNSIDEKFVLPLLFSTISRVQIWTAEEEAVLYDWGEINLERDIENALATDKYQGEVVLNGKEQAGLAKSAGGEAARKSRKEVKKLEESQQEEVEEVEEEQEEDEEQQEQSESKDASGNSLRITYQLQIQGLGFSSWLKNIAQLRELQQQKAYSHEQIKAKKEETKRKLLHKKQKFERLSINKNVGLTQHYYQNELDEIIQGLKE